MARILVVSRHFASEKRKTSIHFFIESLLAAGYKVDFVTVGISAVNRYKHDEVWQLVTNTVTNNWTTVSSGLRSYVWVAPFHPFNLRNKLLNVLSEPLFSYYSRLLPEAVKRAVAGCDLIIFEAGVPLLLFDVMARLAPGAKTFYSAADRLSTLNVHPMILKAERKVVSRVDLVRVPAAAMLEDFPSASNVQYIPQGISKKIFDVENLNPYTGKTNAVSVGNMLFDPWMIDSLGKAFPEVTFHLFGGGLGSLVKGDNIVCYGEVEFAAIVPYLQHADVGLAPYRAEKNADYLAQSSLKIIQYTYCELPIVAPEFAVAGRLNGFGYIPANKTSLISAFVAATSFDRTSIDKSGVKTWSQVTDQVMAELGLAANVTQ